MSKNKEIGQFISVSGIATDIVHKLAQAVAERGGDLDDLRRIISDAPLCGELADRLVRRDSNSLAVRIAACQFQHVDHNIIEVNFPITSGSVATVHNMLTLTQKDLGGQNMTIAEIEATIDQKGYRRATFVELIAYAKAKWNGKDLVVALGSSWVIAGDRNVPCLFEDSCGRGLGLRSGHPEGRPGRDVLYLVVPK